MPRYGELPIGMRFRPTLFEMANYFLKYKALNLTIKARTIPEECLDIFSTHPRDLHGYGIEDHMYFYCRKLADQVTTNSYSLWKLTGEETHILNPKNNDELVGIKCSYSFIENEEESDNDNLSEEEEAPRYNWFMDEISLPLTVVDTDWVLCHIFCKKIKLESVNLPLVESESDHGEEEEADAESLDVVKEKDEEDVIPPPSSTP